MSLLLITKRGTSKRIIDEEINYNWAGNEFKNFQEDRKTEILFKKRKHSFHLPEELKENIWKKQ